MRLVALGVVIVLIPLTAAAQGSDEATPEASAPEETVDPAARIHFEAGRVHYDRGAYEDAAREFLAAYEIDPAPELLFNLYSANERAGNAREAAGYLERFLAEGTIADDERPTLQARLDNLRQRLAAETAEPEAPAEPPRRTPAPAPERGGGGIGTPAIASFIAGGVGLVAFGIFAALAASEDGRLAADCGTDAGGFCSDEQIGTLRAFTIAADVGLGVGVLGVGLGIVLALAGVGAGPDEDEHARVVPWLGPTSVGALVEVRP
jgi:hypothetical protein